jgi:integrase
MRRTKGDKPEKPFAAYPLFAHNSGQWAKRINGKECYFGVWSDPTGALNKYLAQSNGLTFPESVDTVGQRVKRFLGKSAGKLATGDIEQITYDEYETTCEVITRHYGAGRMVHGLDFNTLRVALAQGKKIQTLSPVTLKRRLSIARAVFKSIADADEALAPPSARVLRAAREAAGQRFFEASDVRALIAAADDEFRWLLLLGINCGFGPKDCQLFPGPDGEWHNFARPKTGVGRRCWLWPETVAALEYQCEGWNRSNVAKAFRALCDATEVPNHGFYSLKRTFSTVAENEGPASVLDRICGWAGYDMASVYRQKSFDDKIRAMLEGVRNWYLSGE